MRRWSTVAVLARPWGARGELLADACTAHPERLSALQTVHLLLPGSQAPRRLELEWVRPYRQRYLLKFRGVDSIGQAEQLAGAEVCTPLEERPPAPEGEYYQADLIGCSVFEQASGRLVGKVTGWIETGGTPLLEVAGASSGQEILIPFARSICVEVDVDQKRILADMPEGLEELNWP